MSPAFYVVNLKIIFMKTFAKVPVFYGWFSGLILRFYTNFGL